MIYCEECQLPIDTDFVECVERDDKIICEKHLEDGTE